MRLFTLFVLILLINIKLLSQESFKDFIIKTDSIATIIFTTENDSVKAIMNRGLETEILDFLHKSESISFTYDSLRFAKYLESESGDLAILTWVVPLQNNAYLYSGFIKKMSAEKIDTVFQLKPSADEISENKSYTAENWPGAVYSEIIHHSIKDQDFYTLIGWQGKGEGLSGRILEALWFDEGGVPVFGFPVFRSKSGDLMYRYFFEFTDQVPFHLAYERHKLPGEKRKWDWMIIFNRLTGNQPGMGRFFRGAVPSYEFFDAFVFRGNQWVFFEDTHPRIDNRTLPDERPVNLNLSPER